MNPALPSHDHSRATTRKVIINVTQDQDGSMTHQFDPQYAEVLKGMHEVRYRLRVDNNMGNDDQFEIHAVYACDPHEQLGIPSPIPPGSQEVTLTHLNRKPCLINIGIVVRNVTRNTSRYCDPEIINDPSRVGPLHD
jgi:hypothetical protein